MVSGRTAFERWAKSTEFTAAQIGGLIGVGRVTVQRYMAGAAMPRPERVARIEYVSYGRVTAAQMHEDFRR